MYKWWEQKWGESNEGGADNQNWREKLTGQEVKGEESSVLAITEMEKKDIDHRRNDDEH